jgi:hypothetical protein
MTIREHDLVVLTADIPEENLKQGDVGTVVLTHRAGAGYEAEFATLAGETLAGERRGTRVASSLGRSEHRLSHRHRQLHLVKHPGRVEVVLAGLVDHSQQASGLCLNIREQRVQLSPLESRLVA